MDIIRRPIRLALVACAFALNACAAVPGGSYFTDGRAARLECPSDSILVCEETHRGRECGCAQQSLIWLQ